MVFIPFFYPLLEGLPRAPIISSITKNWGRIDACARFGEGLITQENIYPVVRAVRLCGRRIVWRYLYFYSI